MTVQIVECGLADFNIKYVTKRLTVEKLIPRAEKIHTLGIFNTKKQSNL